jgi:hypothetical protein
MFSRKLKLGLAIGAATISFAGAAQAAVVDYDQPKLTGSGYDFGGSSLVGGSPSKGGELAFDHSGGKIEPRLTGTIHMDGVSGTCARMHLEYFDDRGNSLTTAKHGGTVCVNDNSHHKFTVDLDPYADADIDHVKVQLEKETATGWYVVDNATFYVNTHDDKVKITQSGVDFGSSGWNGSSPTGSGEMAWGLDGSVVTPHLEGTLHINNSAGLCARMNLRYLTESGTFLHKEHGGDVCASDNGHHSWTVDLDPYDSNKIGKVKVQLQTQGSNGSWNVAGSKTVSIAE